MNYVYILRCADDTLYCGWTTDLTKRLVAHNSGRGAQNINTMDRMWFSEEQLS